MASPEIEFASVWSLCLAADKAVGVNAIWSTWSLAPAVTIPLFVFGLLYALGAWRRAVEPGSKRDVRHEATAAAAATILLVVALVSPICRLSAALASIHMVQHLVIVALVPPLIVVADSSRTLSSALPAKAQAIDNADWWQLDTNRPLLSAAVYGALIWFWHVPAVYQLALVSASWHLLYLGSTILVSLWFWNSAIRTASVGAAALALVITMIHTGLLGALLTFASRPLYPIMSPGALAFGLSPLEDQQLAGLIMWVPMGMVYLIGALVVVCRGLVAHSLAKSSVVRTMERAI